MALRTVHLVFGQSNARGAAQKSALTDTRYDLSDPDVQAVYVADDDPVVGPETMTIHDAHFSVDAPIGHRRKAAGEALPLVIRYGVGGTSLATSWRPAVTTGQYVNAMATLWERLDYCRRTAFPGDTFEFRSLTWIQGEADAISDADTAAYEANLRQLIAVVRRDVAPGLPVFVTRLSSSYGQVGSSPARTAAIQAAQDAVGASIERVYVIGTDDVPLQADATHYTADGYMLLGDLVADAMEADGLADVKQHSQRARTFLGLEDAQAFGGDAQSALGDRDENPANGGFGTRGPGALDPWPTTARSAIQKHPYRNEWLVMIDPAMEADETLDTDTNRRPVDGSFWGYV